MRRTSTIAALAATAALAFGSGVAAADSIGYPVEGVPNVVGMSEQDATTTLSDAGIPYSITNRAGSTMTDCTVTDQHDKGYITETRPEWNSTDRDWDFIEYDVWQGVGLTVFCN